MKKFHSLLCTLSILMIFVSACSSKKADETSTSNNSVDVIEAPETAPTTESKPVIDEANSGQTENSNPENVYHKKNKDLHISLHLGPGLYNTFSYVGFFKGLEKNRVKIHSLSGTEFGAVMAALYAKHKKSSLVEWELFKLLQGNDQDLKVYSETWKRAIKAFIQNNFARVDFNQLEIELKIPVYHNGKWQWITEGNVAQALNQSLALDLSLSDIEKQYAAMEFSGLDEEETLVAIDVLSQNQSTSYKEDNFKKLLAALTKASTSVKKHADIYMPLKYPAAELDKSSFWQKNNPTAITYGMSLARKVNSLETKSVP